MWHDSDDDKIETSLVNQGRLRKLRTNEEECSISGTEYSKRLRLQYVVWGEISSRISSANDVDALFELKSQVDANDDVATLLRSTTRFIGSSRSVPSGRLDIQKLSEFELNDDNGKGHFGGKRSSMVGTDWAVHIECYSYC